MTTAPPLTAADSGSFDELVLRAGTPVLVDFWAPWCGTCRLLAPVLRDVAAELLGRIAVVAVDADADPAITERFGVRGLPTLLLFDGGTEQLRLTGAHGKAALLRHLEPWTAARSVTPTS